jgi:hypothetical protein
MVVNPFIRSDRASGRIVWQKYGKDSQDDFGKGAVKGLTIVVPLIKEDLLKPIRNWFLRRNNPCPRLY